MIPTPTNCSWAKPCLLDQPFADGSRVGYIERGPYGDRAYPAGDMPQDKWSNPIVAGDPYAGTYGIGSDLVTAASFWPGDTVTETRCCEVEQPAPVPLPAAGMLLPVAFVALAMLRRRA